MTTARRGFAPSLLPSWTATHHAPRTMQTKYRVFHRTWWKRNPSWPQGREPGVGPRHFIAYAWSEEEARDICQKWNQFNDPGLLSDRAEYEQA